MDNFSQYFDNRVPQFVSKSIIKRKTRLSVHDVILQHNIKTTPFQTNKKQLSNLPITTPITSNKYNKQIKLPITINKTVLKYKTLSKQKLRQRYMQKQERFKQNNTEEQQLKEQQSYQFRQMQHIRYKSQQKLPVVVKCNVQLDYDQAAQDKLIRIKKQIPKAKLNKMHGHYRHLSQKYQLLRIKPSQKQQHQQQLASIIKEQSQLNPNNLQNQRRLYIRNLIINTNQQTSQQQLKQKQKSQMNLLMNKLKQTQRRGKFGINMVQRKHYQQITPIQLKTNKIHYQQMQKDHFKQEIMSKFTKQFKNKDKVRKQFRNKGKEHMQDYVCAWNQGQAYGEYHQQF